MKKARKAVKPPKRAGRAANLQKIPVSLVAALAIIVIYILLTAAMEAFMTIVTREFPITGILNITLWIAIFAGLIKRNKIAWYAGVLLAAISFIGCILLMLVSILGHNFIVILYILLAWLMLIGLMITLLISRSKNRWSYFN